MARLNPKQIITADGDYDFEIVKGRLYSFNFFVNSGSCTITPKELSKTSTGTASAPMYHPVSGNATITTASAVAKGFTFRATGEIFRANISSASSLNGAFSIQEVPHGRS